MASTDFLPLASNRPWWPRPISFRLHLIALGGLDRFPSACIHSPLVASTDFLPPASNRPWWPRPISVRLRLLALGCLDRFPFACIYYPPLALRTRRAHTCAVNECPALFSYQNRRPRPISFRQHPALGAHMRSQCFLVFIYQDRQPRPIS